MTIETMNSEQCGELLHCTPKHVEELAREGEIPGTKIGREWIFVRSDMLAYLAERGREEAAERRRKRTARASQPVAIKPRRRTPPALLPH